MAQRTSQATGVVLRRGYAGPPGGQVHYALAEPTDGPVDGQSSGLPGEPPTVLLLHQTPRSWDEYRQVLPLLAARGLRAVAPDTPGFGASDPVDGEEHPDGELAGWAARLLTVPDALGVEGFAVAGHHTGGVVAIELAAAVPDRVAALVLSSTPLVDEAFRSRPHGVDEVRPDPDGGHLRALWAGRQGFYPPDRPDLLERFVRDALVAGTARTAAGHHAVRRYPMERRLPLVRARVRLVGAPQDPFGYPNLARMAAALPAAEVVELAGGMVPLPDQLPDGYAAAVADFVLAAR